MKMGETNHQACLVVLVGLPGSGKTALGRELTSFLKSQQCCVNCVSYDEIVSLEEQASIAQSASSDTTRAWRLVMRDRVEAVLCTTPTTSSSIRVAIVDDNNYYRSMRHEYYQLAAKYTIGYLQVYLQCPVQYAIAANRRRPKEQQVPDCVILEMDAKLEGPSENWENCIIVNPNSDLFVLNAIWDRVQAAVEHPVAAHQILEARKALSDQSRLCNELSVIHNIDKALRKAITQLVRDQKEGKNVFAEKLNANRLAVLDSIKSGVAVFSSDSEEIIDQQTLNDWGVSLLLQLSPFVKQ